MVQMQNKKLEGITFQKDILRWYKFIEIINGTVYFSVRFPNNLSSSETPIHVKESLSSSSQLSCGVNCGQVIE